MHIPQRMCVSCKKRDDKNNLIRIARTKKKPIHDHKKQRDGRAIYVCKDEKCIDLLNKSNAIQRFLSVEALDIFYEKLKNIK